MRYAAIASLVLVWTLELSAQNAAPRSVEESRFDVASVRANTTPLGPGTLPSIQPITGGIAARNVPAFDLITFVYSINPVRVLNAPMWTLSERFTSDPGLKERSGLQLPVRHPPRLKRRDL